MENPKKGASKSDLQSKSTLCFSPKAKPGTHTPMAERQTRRTASQKRCGWRPLELGPGGAGQSTNVLHQAHTPGPSAHKVPSTPFLSPTCSSDASGPLGPGQETKIDNGHGQGAQTCPHHGPWRAWRLSYCHRTQPPTHRDLG